MQILSYIKGIKIKQFRLGFFLIILTGILASYLAFTQEKILLEEPLLPAEPPINWWTLVHIIGVIGYYLFIDSLKETKYITITVLVSLIAFVEIMEHRYTPRFWETSWMNNFVDIIAGIICAFIMWMFAETSRFNR